jgi:hypothetical protein
VVEVVEVVVVVLYCTEDALVDCVVAHVGGAEVSETRIETREPSRKRS